MTGWQCHPLGRSVANCEAGKEPTACLGSEPGQAGDSRKEGAAPRWVTFLSFYCRRANQETFTSTAQTNYTRTTELAGSERGRKSQTLHVQLNSSLTSSYENKNLFKTDLLN